MYLCGFLVWWVCVFALTSWVGGFCWAGWVGCCLWWVMLAWVVVLLLRGGLGDLTVLVLGIVDLV